MKELGMGRKIKRDVSKRPLGISSPSWCDSKVAGVQDLVCMKNFGVIGRVQMASTNDAYVPFEGHFERLHDCNLLFTRQGGEATAAGAERENYSALFSW